MKSSFLPCHAERAVWYAPLSFLREHQGFLATAFLKELSLSLAAGDIECVEGDVRLWVKHLPWDCSACFCL